MSHSDLVEPGGPATRRGRKIEGARGALLRVVASAVALGGGCAGTALPPLGPVGGGAAAATGGGAAAAGPGAADRGRDLFNGWVRTNVNCYTCHNGDGAGTWRGPNLAKRVPKLSDAEIASTISEGPGLMPSFKGKVDDEEVHQLVAWLRSQFPKAP